MNEHKPAFPFVGEHSNLADHQHYYSEGLTKREYFSAMAMQGILAAGKGVYTNQDPCNIEPEYISEHAITLADSLLKQLEVNK